MSDFTLALQIGLIIAACFGLVAVFNEKGCDCDQCANDRAERRR